MYSKELVVDRLQLSCAPNTEILNNRKILNRMELFFSRIYTLFHIKAILENSDVCERVEVEQSFPEIKRERASDRDEE